MAGKVEDRGRDSEAADGPESVVRPRGERKELSWKQKLLRGSLALLALLLVLFFLFRWAGTSTYRGTVERVYEKGTEYRVEFWDEEGKVHVVRNHDVRFPYFKLNTADVHAQLNRLAKTEDLVELKVWGFRQTWLSMFPNVISVEFLESEKERTRRRAEHLAEVIEAELRNRGALQDGVDARKAIEEAILRAERETP